MRIYSDKILNLHYVLRAPPRHIFVVRRTQPAILTSKSSIAWLTVNRSYYLYENFAQNTVLDHLGNYLDTATTPYGKMPIWLPMAVAVGDRILVHEEFTTAEKLPQLA